MTPYLAIGLAVLALPVLAVIPYHIRAQRNVSLAREVAEDVVPLLLEGKTDLALSRLDEAGGHFSLLARRLIQGWGKGDAKTLVPKLEDSADRGTWSAAGCFQVIGWLDIVVGLVAVVVEPGVTAVLCPLGFIALFVGSGLAKRHEQVRQVYEAALARIAQAIEGNAEPPAAATD